jgi:hypothetical protein
VTLHYYYLHFFGVKITIHVKCVLTLTRGLGDLNKILLFLTSESNEQSIQICFKM